MIFMRYAKMLAQVVATVLVALVPYLAVGALDASAWVNIAIVGVGALAVFAAPNVPGAPVTKTILAALSAVLVLLTSVITGGITLEEWLQLALAALGALGVFAIPNAGGVARGLATERRGFGRTDDTDLV